MLDRILNAIRPLVPSAIFLALQPLYHLTLSFVGALLYGFPSNKIKIVGVTGTKGKSSVVHIVSAILEEAGFKTATASTVHFKIGDQIKPNLFKMTMPGRFFLQKFIRKAVRKKCDWLVLEMTSEGTKLSRHRFIELNALIFTNLTPEHIESHGSYERYVEAKLKIAKSLENSHKENRCIVANSDSNESEKFLNVEVERKIPYSLKDATNIVYTENGTEFEYQGAKIQTKLKGEFNVYNIIAAASFAKHLEIPLSTIKDAIYKIDHIPGRGEEVKGKNFTAVVDYAHTAESLEAIYKAYAGKRKICVLGSTGGGRDKWKRPKMGAVADQYCEKIILTDEDPYNEDPGQIVAEIRSGIKKHAPEIIMDRREAINKALKMAQSGDVVLITGKGTDPYIMGKDNKKTPWSDIAVVREEMDNLRAK